MTLEKPNRKQLELLKSIELPKEEWARDIIWLKRMDAVSNPDVQQKANQTFRGTIQEHKLYSKKFDKFWLISAEDNVWDSLRMVKKDGNKRDG